MAYTVKDALEERRKRKEAEAKKKDTSDTGSVNAVEQALQNRQKRVAESIRTEYNGIISDYNNSLDRFNNGYGQKAFAEEMTSKRLATDKIMGLKRKIESSRSYLGSKEADSYLASLDEILSKYGDRGTVAQSRSKYETKAAYNTAVEQAEWYDKYSDMDAQARQDAMVMLKSGNGAVDTYGPLPSEEAESSRREYNWLKGYDYHATNMEYDVPAARKEIENDEAALARYNELTEQIRQTEQRLTLADRYPDVIDKEATRKELEALYAERDAISITSDEIAAKRLAANQAEDYQSLQSYNALMGNADFKAVGAYDNTVKDNEYKLVNAFVDGKPTGIFGNYDNYYGEHLNEMTDDERILYNYIFSKHGKEEASKYLSALKDTLAQRAAGEMYAFAGNSDVLKTLYAIPAGLDQFKSGITSIFEEDAARTPSATQYAGGMMREDLGSGGKIIYDALSTVANMAPSIAAGAAVGTLNPVLGQWVGASLMGASAGGNAYAEALRNGYSEGQARTYGVLVGTSEAVLEKFVGGVIPFGKMGGIIDGLGKAAARVAGHIAVDSASEFVEEGLQSVLEQTILQNIAFGEQNGWGSIEWEEVLYNAALGALTGGAVSVARNVPGEITQRQHQEILEGKSVIGDGDVDALMEIAHRAVERGGPYANRIQNLSNNVESDASARNIGRLSYAIDDARKAANKAEISETLANAGVSGRELKRAASGIAKAADGFDISDREYGAIQKFEAAKDAYRSATDSDSAIQTKNKKYVDAVIGKPTTYNAQRTENKAIENKEGSYEGAMPNAPAEAVVNATGEVSAIRSFAMTNDGKMGIELENGEVVGIGEVSFNNSADAPVYEVVGSIKGITPAAANVLVSGYDPEGGLTATDYALGVKEAYSYGEMGIAKSALASTVSASMLSPKQLDNAYEVGRMAGEAAVAARVQNNKASSAGAKKTGSVVFENGTSSDNLSAVQKTAVNTMKMLSEAFGISFHVYASRATESGRVYTDKNGKTVKAPNGWYEPSTGDIYIDLNAGNSGQGTMMFTLAHELTHFIKDWSPEKYRVLGNMLTEKLTAQGKNIDELIENEKALAKKRGRNLSSEQAYDEVVAKAMEEMLVSENVQYELAELYEKDKALWQKIMDFIRDFIDHIKSVLSAYEGKTSYSAVAKMVRELGDALPELEQLYVDALADAGEVYSGMQIDIESESVAPVLSERTWSESEYVTLRNKTAETLKSVLGISKKQALKYIDDISSVAKMIADDRVRLDYEASPFGSAFVSNVEYGGSFDYTTLCAKRRLYTGTFSEIQKRLRNTALTPDDILRIRNMMIEAGDEATCGFCYVEGSRANMGKFAKEFIRLYKRDNPDAWIPDMVDVNTPDGVESMRINHPEAYERYEYFWNHYGKLQDSDPALFASQQKPKLYEARKEYKGEILDIFSNDTSVNKKNRNGGIRMQSFSDFEIVHMIDTMQVIMDMARVGLAGQAYTKVPAFARAFGSTGLKINLSLIAKGVDENGNLIFDDREGMPHETAFEIRNEFSKNVGTVLVIFTDEQLMAAMADPRIDYIIPFHRSQWKKKQYNAMGLPKGTKDYTYMQNEKLIRPTYHEYRGRMVKDKTTNYMPNEYWDFSKSGKENAENYLDMCAMNNKRPKFYKLLDYDGKGRYSLKKDGSTDGYWKLLIDFKMYDNDGVGSQQNPVVPEFEMGYITETMDEYRGGHSTYPVAYDIVDAFVKEYTSGQDERMFSDRDFDREGDAGEYTYEALVSKPDMVITSVNDNVAYDPTSETRKAVVNQAVSNALSYGKAGNDGGVIIHVDDIDTDVLLPKRSLIHGIDRRLEVSAPVILNIGSVLKNSIRINELTPKKASASGSYVLIGYAESSDYAYPVRMVVNQYTNEVDTIDVLYAVNVKKETAGKMPGSHGNAALPTVSNISISHLLDFVNKYFPDVLPKGVFTYYGHNNRPEGDLGNSAKFSDRDTEPVYNVVGETERVVHENKVVDSDVQRLRELIRFHTQEDYGEMYTKTSLQTASKLIREYAGVKSPTPELVSMLDRFYRNIGDGKINTLDGMMEAATEIAAYVEYHREKTDAAKAYYDAVKRADPTVSGADASATADVIAEYEMTERVRDLAYEIYNKYWDMVTLKSFAGEKAAEIGRLKESHRKAMAELRQMRDDKVKATAEYYRDMVARVRENKNAKIDSMKQAYAESREKKRISRIKNEIKHRAERLTSMALHPTEGRYVPAYLIEAVAEVAKGVSYGMDAPAIHETGRYAGQPNLALEKRLKTREALDNLIKQYKDMGKDKDDTYRVEFDKIVLEQLEMFRNKFGYEAKLDELSLEDLIELNDILRIIGGTITDARKLIGETEMGDVYEAGDTLMDEMHEVGKRKDKNLLLNPIKAGTISAMRLVRAASGYNEDSVLYRLFKALEDGARKKSMFIMEAYDLFNPLMTGKNERNYYEATHTYAKPAKGFKPFTWEDVNGKKFSATKMQMMQAVLTYRREIAGDYNHIRGGGLEFASLEEMNRGNMKNAVAANKIHRVNGDEAVRMIGEFENILKDDSWAHDYMEAATDFFNRVAKDAINDVSMKVKHRKIATEDAYIPFEVSKNFRIAQIDSTAMMQKTLENLGMLQNTMPGVSNPLVMTGLGNVLDHHIEDVAGVYGLMIPVRNINKVWNVKAPRNMDSARNAMEGVWGEKTIGYIEQAVRDVQSPKVTERNPILNWIRGNIVGSTFLLNLSVLLKQIGSRGYAASRLSAWNGSTTRSIGDFLYAVFNGKKILNESKKYTATLWERQQGLTNKEVATLRHSAPGIFKRGLKNLGYKVSDIVGRAIGKEVNLTGIGIGIDKLIQWMDFTVGASLWRATMAEVKKNSPDLTGEELLEETARLFDDIIDNTQSINDVLHTSHFQRNHNIVFDPLYMFKNDAYQMAGDLSDATGAFIANKTKENGARLFKSLEGVARSMIWTSAVTVAMAFLRRKEKRYRDEETGDITGESVTKRIAVDMTGEMAGILLPLGGSEIFELIDSIKNGEQYDILESIEYKALTDIITATAKFIGDMDEIDFDTEEGRNKLRENASEVLLKIAPVLGIPANNVKRAYDALMLHIEDAADGGEWFSSGVKRTRKQNLNRITEANDVSEGKDIFDEVIAISAEEKLQTLTENNNNLPANLRKTQSEIEEEAHKEALSDMKSLIGQAYYNGGMEKEEAEMYLREYFGMTENEIYWTMDKWDYHKTNGTSEGYGKYNAFIEAVSSGEGLKREIQRHLSHADSKPGETAAGTEKRVKAALASAITSYFKPLMQKATTKGEQAYIKARCLTAYSALGYSRTEKSRDIDAWLKE